METKKHNKVTKAEICLRVSLCCTDRLQSQNAQQISPCNPPPPPPHTHIPHSTSFAFSHLKVGATGRLLKIKTEAVTNRFIYTFELITNTLVNAGVLSSNFFLSKLHKSMSKTRN